MFVGWSTILFTVFHASLRFPILAVKSRVTASESKVKRKLVTSVGQAAVLSLCCHTTCCYWITELVSLSMCNSLSTNDNNHGMCHIWFSEALKLLCWRGKFKAIISSPKIVGFGFHVHTNLVPGSDFSIIPHLICNHGLLSEMSSPTIRQGKIKLSILRVKKIICSSTFSSDNIH